MRRHGSRRSEDRGLVLLGGLPGAGKTTLLRRLQAPAAPGAGPEVGEVPPVLDAAAVLDAEDVTQRLRAAGVRVPYGLLRPVVHAAHVVRALRAVAGSAPVVVVTDPLTSPLRRGTLALGARLAGRRTRLVLVLATPHEALAGQEARRRVVPARRMGRHERRWARLLDAHRRTGRMPLVDDVVLLDRTEAAALPTPALAAVLLGTAGGSRAGALRAA